MVEYTVETATKKLGELTRRSLEGEKIIIETEKGNVVMISEEDWDSLVEALVLLNDPNISSSTTEVTAIKI